MYKKRWLRQKNKNPETPRTKTRKLLRYFPRKEVKKTLMFHNVLIDQIRKHYKKEKKMEKIRLARMVSGPVLRKYKFKTHAFKVFEVATRITKHKPKKNTLFHRLCQCVTNFYIRDDNSRIMSGLKNTVTVKKNKKQRRILNDSLKNLHLKYLSENNPSLSYTLFCRLRPFWVVFPTERDRNTCLCKLCENTELLAMALKKVDTIPSAKLDLITESLACSISSKDCMFNMCINCSNMRVCITKENLHDDDDNEIRWFQWKHKTEKRKIKVGKNIEEKDVTIVVKEEETGNLSQLIDLFESQIRRYMKHIYIVRSQFNYYKQRRDNLKEDECLLHVDFSENYVCKLHAGIHGTHFGASKKQLSLHTGVYYTAQERKTFCTVSESLQHGPFAIWAHMKPILNTLRKQYPEINKIEIFSDGPTTQYRQKGNFYLFNTELKNFGFTQSVWNFFGSGHGKGIPDSVGGTLKRTADKCVKYGQSVTSAQTFINTIKDSKIIVQEISEEEILAKQIKLENVNLKPIAGTFKIHQFTSDSPDMIAWRELSCLCRKGNECEGHRFANGNLIASKNETNECTTTKSKPIDKTDNDIIMPDNKGIKNEKEIRTNTLELLESERNKKFEEYLKILRGCRTYKGLKDKCKTISVEDFPCIPQSVGVLKCSLEVDVDAIDKCPDDIPDDRSLYPCVVHADGNCLPSCGSVFAFERPNYTSEIRVRIIKELTSNDKLYLDHTFLSLGLPEIDDSRNLPRIYSMYSDMYVPGVQLDNKAVRNIFEQETLKLRIDKSFMGIWQMHALASVLNVPIYSVYPRLGNPNIRKDLNRLIMPRSSAEQMQIPIYILWTSTRSDMTTAHWTPNHFVPLLPVEICKKRAESCANESAQFNCSPQYDSPKLTSTNERTGKVNKERKDGRAPVVTAKRKKNTKCKGKLKKSKLADDTNILTESVPENFEGGDSIDKETERQIEDDIRSEKVSIPSTKEHKVPEPALCVGKFVIVRYNNKAYPGLVEDAGDSDVYVECMHQVGRKNPNCFFWPRKIKDKCWYDHDNILAMIPEPVKKDGTSSHFEVDREIWDAVSNNMK